MLKKDKQMQIENPPICKNTDQYVQKAIELANLDYKNMLDLKHNYQKKAKKFLYEDKNFIEEMNVLLRDLYKKNEKA